MDGVRDPGPVESALARPANLARYGNPDAADLAAAYAYGIAKNHGFLDGNKRTAWVTARLFLADNGRRLEFDPADAIVELEPKPGQLAITDEDVLEQIAAVGDELALVMLGNCNYLSSGRIGEAELAAWFRSRTTQSAPEDESVT